jgi:hypothetical protein
VARLTTEGESRIGIQPHFLSEHRHQRAGKRWYAAICPSGSKLAGFAMQAAEVKRMILIASWHCIEWDFSLAASAEFRRRKANLEPQAQKTENRFGRSIPSCSRFLPLMALWSATLACFTPFAYVYLIARSSYFLVADWASSFRLRSDSTMCRAAYAVGFSPAGSAERNCCHTGCHGRGSGLPGRAHNRGLAVALFLGFSAAQWMSSPGFYNLLMSKVTDDERSSASAMTMFSQLRCFSPAQRLGAGIQFARFGYPKVLAGISGLSLTAALLFKLLISPTDRLGAA